MDLIVAVSLFLAGVGFGYFIRDWMVVRTSTMHRRPDQKASKHFLHFASKRISLVSRFWSEIAENAKKSERKNLSIAELASLPAEASRSDLVIDEILAPSQVMPVVPPRSSHQISQSLPPPNRSTLKR